MNKLPKLKTAFCEMIITKQFDEVESQVRNFLGRGNNGEPGLSTSGYALLLTILLRCWVVEQACRLCSKTKLSPNCTLVTKTEWHRSMSSQIRKADVRIGKSATLMGQSFPPGWCQVGSKLQPRLLDWVALACWQLNQQAPVHLPTSQQPYEDSTSQPKA